MAPRRRSAATEEEEIESTSAEVDLTNLEKSTVPALGESDVVTADAGRSALISALQGDCPGWPQFACRAWNGIPYSQQLALWHAGKCVKARGVVGARRHNGGRCR
jgi:hypothetical protein